MKHHPLAAKVALMVIGALTVSLITAAPVGAEDRTIGPPDEAGLYNVGFTTFLAEMSGGRVTTVQVFYPTFEAADEHTQYTIQSPVGTFQVDSPFWAVHDAPPVPGQFPLVVFDHGMSERNKEGNGEDVTGFAP